MSWDTCELHQVDYDATDGCPVCSAIAERDYARDKPVRMLTDLVVRFAEAARQKDKPLMDRYFNLIDEFRWAWPDVAEEYDRRYDRTEKEGGE